MVWSVLAMYRYVLYQTIQGYTRLCVSKCKTDNAPTVISHISPQHNIMMVKHHIQPFNQQTKWAVFRLYDSLMV